MSNLNKLVQGPCHRGGGGAEGPCPLTFCDASSFKAAVKGKKALAPTFASLGPHLNIHGVGPVVRKNSVGTCFRNYGDVNFAQQSYTVFRRLQVFDVQQKACFLKKSNYELATSRKKVERYMLIKNAKTRKLSGFY